MYVFVGGGYGYLPGGASPMYGLIGGGYGFLPCGGSPVYESVFGGYGSSLVVFLLVVCMCHLQFE